MTTTTIQKWGNSYAVRLPKAAIARLKLGRSRAVRISETNGGLGLSLTPIPDASLDLRSLVARITPQNRHGAAEWGAPVGKEAW